MPPSPARLRFAAVLRERTKLVHREAERTGFMAALIRGRATRACYELYLRCLLPVYERLEGALDREAAPIALAFAAPGLRRSAALRADIAAVEVEGVPIDLEVPSAARDYVAAVDAAARASPYRLAAHAYARYLGDLSGGQILKPLLQRSLALGPDALRFYDFPAYADLDAPKVALRDALDEVAVGSPEAEAFVDEAIASFRHNMAVSAAIGSEVP
jgi:heme oxygenase (biliverdin-producing, ferredoxin)